MNIVNYSAGADTGGQAIRLQRAFAKYSTHHYRSIVRSTNYIRYPQDLAWNYRGQAFREAHLIHANNSFRTLERVRKPMVIHYHGTQFRRSPKSHLIDQRARKVRGLVSTLDLWLLAPNELIWVPAPYDLDWLADFRKPQDGPLRIGHAPTARPIKSTGHLIAAVEKLKQDRDVELVLIERQTWDRCLTMKGTVDVFFDQVLLGYGNNTIEAMGMGIPVIAGGQLDTLAEMRNRFGELPFYEATEDTIYDALKVLTDEITRKQWGERGLAHAKRFHDETLIVRQLEGIYNEVGE